MVVVLRQKLCWHSILQNQYLQHFLQFWKKKKKSRNQNILLKEPLLTKGIVPSKKLWNNSIYWKCHYMQCYIRSKLGASTKKKKLKCAQINQSEVLQNTVRQFTNMQEPFFVFSKIQEKKRTLCCKDIYNLLAFRSILQRWLAFVCFCLFASGIRFL